MKSVFRLLICLLVAAQIYGDDDVGEIFEMTSAELDELKADCLNTTGNNDAFDNYIREKDVAKTCVSKIVDLEEFAIDLGLSVGLGISETFVTKYCPILNKTSVCLIKLVKSLLPCYIEEEQTAVRQIVDVMDEILSLVCSKDGQNLIDFMNAKGAYCLVENAESLSECFDTATDGIDFEDAKITYAECQSIIKTKKCVINAMEGCAQLKASEIVEDFFKSLYDMSPCASKQLPVTNTIVSEVNVNALTKEVIVSEITDNDV